jgi:hypothetical protein
MAIFQPMPGKTVSISATGTSASASIPAEAPEVRIHNPGPATVFVRWGVGAQTAVVTDMPVAVGGVEVFTKNAADTIAAITAGTAVTLYITPGVGE